jgi:hypothetical protein
VGIGTKKTGASPLILDQGTEKWSPKAERNVENPTSLLFSLTPQHLGNPVAFLTGTPNRNPQELKI